MNYFQGTPTIIFITPQTFYLQNYSKKNWPQTNKSEILNASEVD